MNFQLNLQKYDGFKCSILRQREVKKTYFCIVSGMLKQKGVLEHQIYKDDANRRMVCFGEDEFPNVPRGTPILNAALHYEPIFHLGHRKRGHLTCLKVTMRTGRKHQIRAQVIFSRLLSQTFMSVVKFYVLICRTKTLSIGTKSRIYTSPVMFKPNSEKQKLIFYLTI